MLEFLKIVALSILAAILYGILHDLVTTRICLEYFTIFHPPIFGGTQNPTLLALGWGVIATWWVGLPLGLILAVAARIGNLPRLTARQLLKSLAFTLLLLAALAALSGYFGYRAALNNPFILPPHIARSIAPNRVAVFNAAWQTHLASYTFGALLALALSLYTLLKRHRLATASLTPGRV